jgi:hypothetical protein
MLSMLMLYTPFCLSMPSLTRSINARVTNSLSQKSRHMPASSDFGANEKRDRRTDDGIDLTRSLVHSDTFDDVEQRTGLSEHPNLMLYPSPKEFSVFWLCGTRLRVLFCVVAIIHAL